MEGRSDAKLKILVVGDAFVGKTSLLRAMCKAPFQRNYTPTICESMTTTVQIRRRETKLHFWDTAGNDVHDRFGELIYAGSDVVLVCFSVNIPASIASTANNWIPRVRHFCPQIPIILVGCKSDLRSIDESKIEESGYNLNEAPALHYQLLNMDEGYAMASRTGAILYLETSAQCKYGIDALIALTGNVALEKKCTTICTIM